MDDQDQNTQSLISKGTTKLTDSDPSVIDRKEVITSVNLEQIPPPTSPQTPSQPPRKHKLIFTLSILLVTALIATGIFLIHTKTSRSTSNTESTSNNTSDSSLAIQYITVPKAVLTAQCSGDPNSGCSTPEDVVYVAGRHYIYEKQNSGGVDEAVIYDGKTVFKSDDLQSGYGGVNGTLLSDNGLHYTFFTSPSYGNGAPYSIYIDGNLLAYKLPGSLSADAYPVALSNDGKTVVYDDQDSSGNDVLYTNGKVSQKLTQLSGVEYSDNLLKSILINDNDSGSQVVLNGEPVTPQNLDLYSGDAVISQNGMHYAYLDDANDPNEGSGTTSGLSTISLIVDGKSMGNIYDPSHLGITNSGIYYYIDASNSTLYINKTGNKLSTEHVSDSALEDGDCMAVAVSNNGKYYFVAFSSGTSGGKNYYDLDGKSVSMPDGLFNAAFNNSTLYIYSVS